MNDRGKIFAIYGTVAVLSALILGTAMYLGNRVPEQAQPDFHNAGMEKVDTFFQIQKDFTGVNQSGEQVKLSDLKGKVWLVAEFFAICPHCAARNGQEIKSLFDQFKDHPDFHVTCISVDPTTDTPERLTEYSKALEADPERWWFMSHPNEKETHEYLEQELKFLRVRERLDPVDREANGRFEHDMSITLVDREWNIVGKWNLYGARSEEGRKQDPEAYERMKAELVSRLTEELEKNETAGIENLAEDDSTHD
ncbi:SCO family protein [Luteolibacter flavescens]|uniref:SCO family protein n=1 Tax=Luteolibacter flavescens TaxID=1859460 RepID=A0ABT3FIN2_9BACT|nr:SCO family protein [Luteolibacter flavescens]MCW1883214.1 SCO family protein [Luteolibacter flavescens]